MIEVWPAKKDTKKWLDLIDQSYAYHSGSIDSCGISHSDYEEITDRVGKIAECDDKWIRDIAIKYVSSLSDDYTIEDHWSFYRFIEYEIWNK